MPTGSAIAFFWLVCTLALICGHCFYLWRKRRFLLFEPLNTFWGGILIVYVMQSIQYGSIISRWHSPGALEKTLFWLFVGMCFVIVGYHSSLGIKVHRFLPSLPVYVNPKRMYLASIVTIGLGVFGYTLRFIGAGGLTAWASVGRGAESRLPLGLAQLMNLILLLPYGIPLLLMHVYMHDVPKKRRIMAWLLYTFFLLWILYEGSRSRTIVLVLGGLAAYYLPKRRNPPLRLLVPIGMLLLVVVPFLGMYRGQFTGFSFHLDEINWSAAGHALLPSWLVGEKQHGLVITTEPSPGMELNCSVVAVELAPDPVDYNYGYCLLEIFTHPIPRALWPNGKPYPLFEALTPLFAGGHLTEMWINYGRKPFLAGPAFCWVGFWWAVGGPITIILAGLYTGVMFRMLRHFWDRTGGGQGDTLYLLVLMPIGFFEAASTPILNAVVHQSIQLVIFFIAIRMVGLKYAPASSYPQIAYMQN